MNCIKCGRVLMENEKFCPGCGTRVEQQLHALPDRYQEEKLWQN